MRTIHCGALVIGAGAAGLNAADELKQRGVDVLLCCDSLQGGTSLNAGSDKQTYYKLSLSGDTPDSVTAMAQGLFDGGGMHGDHARIMAALSVRGFMKLAVLGVPFPHNAWGEYVGYQTDHDATTRATSAGPLTSRMMAERLLASAQAHGVPMAQGLHLLAILTGGSGRCCGALFYDGRDYVAVSASSVVLATGGPAMIYENTVYPTSQCGASGAAIRAGAATSNLCYWQYGLASLKVRWNVSGSYQQAIPSYTDGEREFLPPHFHGRSDMLTSVFLKGYQWPFDARKLIGSSRVDMAVAALRAHGGRAYLDYTREPAGGALNGLSNEGKAYLANCGALQGTPFERLAAINRQAVEFYLSHGIDLSREPLEIAVCAQHANGGLRIDHWWQTTVPGLYACGECAGAFGPYRPGGSALNETQVGSLRAAEHIAADPARHAVMGDEAFMNLAGQCIAENMALFSRVGDDAARILPQARSDMDNDAGAMRDTDHMAAMLQRINHWLAGGVTGSGPAETALLLDTLVTQREALSAMLCQAALPGECGHGFTEHKIDEHAPDTATVAIETRGGQASIVPLRPLPQGGGWFEQVWKQYQSGEVFA